MGGFIAGGKYIALQQTQSSREASHNRQYRTIDGPGGTSDARLPDIVSPNKQIKNKVAFDQGDESSF